MQQIKKRKLDVAIFASSRPELLKITIERFMKFAHFYGDFRFILNEDFVFPKESEKVLKWASDQDIFKKEDIHYHNPPLGLIKSTKYVLDRIKTPFFFNLQDDWAFERPVELDRVLRLMEMVNRINLIIFAKHRIPKEKSGIKLKQYTFPMIDKGIVLTQYSTWSFIPGIWRSSISIPAYKKAMNDKSKRTAPARMTHHFRTPKQRKDCDFLYENMGAYFYGGHGEWRYVRHIGENARMEEWRIEGDKPGKEGISQETNIIHLAPWIPFEHIPPIKGRDSEKIIKKELKKKRGDKVY